MEIHTSDKAPESWKETMKHLAMITAGVLIALAFEGVVAWADHRLLVREARANLTAELRGNRAQLNSLLANLDKETEQLEHADDVAGLVLAHGPMTHLEMTLASHDAELKNAAVTTGEITGAFGYMKYADVRRYADVYDLQAQFMRAQEREGERFTEVLAFVRRLTAKEPPPADAVMRWRSQIDVALTGIYLREQLARQLLARYDEMLAGR